nr:DinB family protein [Haliscomenobacter sp.]
MHLVGNLNTYIGAEFGKTGYIRNRDLEFSQKDVPQTALLAKIEDTIAVVDLALSQLSEAQLQADYPQEVFAGKTMTTEYFLIHLVAHLSYHLGQINYHRRLLDK